MFLKMFKKIRNMEEKNIYNKIYKKENLNLAWQNAKTGKTKRRYVKIFVESN
jgi:hypothetical protein